MENGKANSGSDSKGRPEDAELVLASPTDYLLYSPLLPEVATGAIDPRHIAVPLHGVLKRTRIILGDTTGVDLEARTCAVRPPNAPERVLGWDRLVLAPGGVTRSLPIPGLAERAAPSWWWGRDTSEPSSRRRCSTLLGRHWETT